MVKLINLSYFVPFIHYYGLGIHGNQFYEAS